MIKAVIFDLGGVVLTHRREVTLETLAEIFNAKLEDIKDYYEILEDEWLTGKISGKDVVATFKNKFTSKKSVDNLLRQWQTMYEKGTKTNKGVLDTVDNLKKAGYKVYLLTDTVDFHHKLNLKRDIFTHFDKVFASFIEGKRKTNKDFYEYVLRKISHKPQDCIFIDDRGSILKVAQSVGIKTILFKDDRNLTKKLNKLLLQKLS